MRVFVAIIGLVIGVTSVLGDVCSGRHNGAQLPNEADCGSYFVCEFGRPTLVQCSSSLMYDHRLGVCNWPEYVPCDQVTGEDAFQPWYPPVPGPPTMEHIQPPQPQPQQPQPPQLPQPQPPQPQPPQLPPQIPTETNPQFPPPLQNGGQSDKNQYYPGVALAPNTKFGVQCTIDGFYFVPHFDQCEHYFICENRHIHAHQCASGIHWDYVYMQCDYAEKAFCFRNSTYSPIYHPLSSSPDPTTIGVTAPVAIEQPIVVTEAPEDEPVEDAVMVCPEDASFMAHERDCHKYYICIASLPIAISCPEHMAWDDASLQCTDEALALCHPYAAITDQTNV